MAWRGVGWLTIALFLLAINLIAGRVTWDLMTVPESGPGSGPSTAYRTYEHFADGRSFLIITNHRSGEVKREQLRPRTWEGLEGVWCPVVSASVFSLLVIWFFRRDSPWRLWAFATHSRKSIGWAMIVVAFIAVDTGPLLAWMRSGGRLPDVVRPGLRDLALILLTWKRSFRVWLVMVSRYGTPLCVVLWNLLALILIGIVVSYLPKFRREERGNADPTRPGSEGEGVQI